MEQYLDRRGLYSEHVVQAASSFVVELVLVARHSWKKVAVVLGKGLENSAVVAAEMIAHLAALALVIVFPKQQHHQSCAVYLAPNIAAGKHSHC